MSNEIFLQQYAKTCQDTASQLLADIMMLRTQAALKQQAEAEVIKANETLQAQVEELKTELAKRAENLESLTNELATTKHTLKVTHNAYTEAAGKLKLLTEEKPTTKKN